MIGLLYLALKLAKVSPFLPDSLTCLGEQTFNGCVALKGDLRLRYGGVPVTLQTNGRNNNGFQNAAVDSVSVGPAITSIPGYTFINCSSMTNLVLHNGITSIGWEAFNYCSNLEHVEPFLPEALNSIGIQTFASCPKLKGNLRICFGDGVKFAYEAANQKRGSQAFNRSAIETMTIGSNFTVITNGAFSGISTLKAVYWHKFPAGGGVGASAFPSGTALKFCHYVPDVDISWNEYIATSCVCKNLADGDMSAFKSQIKAYLPKARKASCEGQVAVCCGQLPVSRLLESQAIPGDGHTEVKRKGRSKWRAPRFTV